PQHPIYFAAKGRYNTDIELRGSPTGSSPVGCCSVLVGGGVMGVLVAPVVNGTGFNVTCVNGTGVDVPGAGGGVLVAGTDVSVAVGVSGSGVAVLVDGTGVLVGVGASIQSDEMVLASIVTAPVRARALPDRLALVFSVILAR